MYMVSVWKLHLNLVVAHLFVCVCVSHDVGAIAEDWKTYFIFNDDKTG